MKKLLLILALAKMVCSGCHKKSDDALPDDASTKIIGRWREGAGLLIYYVAGKEVYRETTAASTGVDAYDEFRVNGIFADFTLISSNYYEVDGTYALSNNNTTLQISIQGQSASYQFSFTDNNTISISGTSTNAITYYKNGISYSADSATIQESLIRM